MNVKLKHLPLARKSATFLINDFHRAMLHLFTHLQIVLGDVGKTQKYFLCTADRKSLVVHNTLNRKLNLHTIPETDA